MTTKPIGIGVLVGLTLIIAAIYSPGLNGPYVLDDHENIVLNTQVALAEITYEGLKSALISNESGPLGRPLAALSFAINHYLAGGFNDTLAFKATNLAIHLLNTVLVYLLTLCLAQTPALRSSAVSCNHHHLLALFTSAIWGMHPIQLTNVLYVVQRMNSMSAFFVLLGLLIFLHGRKSFPTHPSRDLFLMAIGIAFGTAAGVMAKENALLLPLFALTVELVLFPKAETDHHGISKLRQFYGITVILPVVLASLYLITHPEYVTSAYAERNFTLYERVLTEARVLWFYVRLILLPTPSTLGLFHDDIPTSTGVFVPISTAVSIVAIICAVLGAFALRRRYPAITFAVAWFIVGHALESSIFGLEIAYEHRNYLPSFGILFGITYTIHRALAAAGFRYGLLAACVTVPLVLAATTWSRSHAWADTRTLADDSVRHHPLSARANDFAARVAIEQDGNYEKAIEHVLQGMHVAPREAGFHIELRMLLTILAVEINQSSAMAAWKKTPGSALRIEGLPPAIAIDTSSKRLVLSHQLSSDEVIRHLLTTNPITVHEIVSLENLRTCILEPPRACESLKSSAKGWLTSAGTNPRTSNAYRAIALSGLAQLFAADGKLDQAYRIVSDAEAIDPSQPWYRLQRIDYLLRSGHRRDAWQLFMQTNLNQSINSPSRDLLARLHEAFKHYRP